MDGTDPAEHAHLRFVEWIAEKHPALTVPDVGSASVGTADVALSRGSSDMGSICRWVLHEDDGSARWNTTLTVTNEAESDTHWLWLDLEHVNANYFERVDVASPRIVRRLLEDHPSYRGRLRLRPRLQLLGLQQLEEFVDHLVDPGRELPLVLFSVDGNEEHAVSRRRAERAAANLAGVANVHLLSGRRAEIELPRLVGRDLSVWGGACRLYMPAIDLADPQPWRHRYFPPRLFGRREADAGLRLSAHLSPFMTRQRAPQGYVALRHLLDAESSTFDREWQEEIERLKRESDELEDRYYGAVDDVESLTEQVANLRREMSFVWKAVNAAGVGQQVTDQLMGAVEAPDVRLADPHSPFEVVELAKQLRFLVLPNEACFDLEQLDQAIESRAWARSAWRGLVALDRYAETASSFGGGGFHEWCAASRDPLVWPATSKKLAMVESGYVRTNERLYQARLFPIDTAIDPSGRLFMESHLKIAEGGGRLAPRIYFHDGTTGPTGKVHIGYYGPHHRIPNKHTN